MDKILCGQGFLVEDLADSIKKKDADEEEKILRCGLKESRNSNSCE